MRKTIVAAVVAASAATSACGHNRTIDAGPNVSRNYQVGNFQQIEVAGPYDVDVKTGPQVSVSANGGEKLLDKTVVEVRGDKLVIGPQEHHSLFHWGWTSNGKAKFTVTVPQLHGATIAGSGNINVDQVQGDRFEGTVAGSGGLGIGKLDVQTLKLAIAGSGGVKASQGKAQAAEYEIAGSSQRFPLWYPTPAGSRSANSR